MSFTSIFKKVGSVASKPFTAPVHEIKDTAELLTVEQKAAAVLDSVKDAKKEGKPFYQSKTVWFNALALAGYALGQGYMPLAPSQAILAVGAINLALRFLTDEPVTSK